AQTRRIRVHGQRIVIKQSRGGNMGMTWRAVAVASIAWSLAAGASAQDAFPTKPIRIVVPLSAGSATDLLARDIGQKMTETWHQPVIVDNRPSAAGVVAGEITARAVPDGHTLMMVS